MQNCTPASQDEYTKYLTEKGKKAVEYKKQNKKDVNKLVILFNIVSLWYWFGCFCDQLTTDNFLVCLWLSIILIQPRDILWYQVTMHVWKAYTCRDLNDNVEVHLTFKLFCRWPRKNAVSANIKHSRYFH